MALLFVRGMTVPPQLQWYESLRANRCILGDFVRFDRRGKWDFATYFRGIPLEARHAIKLGGLRCL